MSQAILGSARWLKQNKMRIASSVLLTASLLSIALPSVVQARPQGSRRTNRNRQLTSSEVQRTLQGVEGVLEGSAGVGTQSDADSAVVHAKNGAVVDVPKDAKKGVTFGAENGPRVDIQLPNAQQAKEAARVAPGVVAYEADNGSANAVQTLEDGSMRMLTVIDTPDAPMAYEYKVTMPEGGSIQMALNGGAVILNGAGQLLSVIDAPWAKDAEDKPIETWFTTDGKALTQHVRHNVPGVVYPVTADPRVSWAWHGATLYLSRGETNAVAGGVAIAAGYFGWTGIGGAAAAATVPAAAWATSHGYCLAVYKNWWNYWPSMWAYRC